MYNEKFKGNLFHNYLIFWENFENFEKMLFFQKWTKWILIDSE
ncbi:hypothetical protein T4B_7014 [Trichinella pseudospiralis]|uniref:Uncharacterized protein n=1 Tax=Trichinella pseudospiralis TaxID=6337 RepID=A0A0V1GHY9_TRIPS|nr:hypothetical protein T4B_7014 [Trichinella pseudospiralis]KRY97836.1 hypothetical protein T4C_8186 [Trichinella pseudospiralis]